MFVWLWCWKIPFFSCLYSLTIVSFLELFIIIPHFCKYSFVANSIISMKKIVFNQIIFPSVQHAEFLKSHPFLMPPPRACTHTHKEFCLFVTGPVSDFRPFPVSVQRETILHVADFKIPSVVFPRSFDATDLSFAMHYKKNWAITISEAKSNWSRIVIFILK